MAKPFSRRPTPSSVASRALWMTIGQGIARRRAAALPSGLTSSGGLVDLRSARIACHEAMRYLRRDADQAIDTDLLRGPARDRYMVSFNAGERPSLRKTTSDELHNRATIKATCPILPLPPRTKFRHRSDSAIGSQFRVWPACLSRCPRRNRPACDGRRKLPGADANRRRQVAVLPVAVVVA